MEARMARALEGKLQLVISVKGRKTGKLRSTTVWFVKEEDKLYLLPVRGSDTSWYKNVLNDANITISIKKEKFRLFGSPISVKSVAQPVTKSSEVQRIVELFAQKYGKNEITRWHSKFDVAVKINL